MSNFRTIEEDLFEILTPEEWLTADAISDKVEALLSAREQSLPSGGPDALCCTYLGLSSFADELWLETRSGPLGNEHRKEYRLSPIGTKKKQQLFTR